MTDTKSKVIYEIVKKEKNPFKPLDIRSVVGIQPNLLSHYLKSFVEHGVLIKEGSYYRVLSTEGLISELEGSERGRLAWPSHSLLSDFKLRADKAVAARVLGDDIPTLKMLEEMKELKEAAEEARRYIMRKTMSESTAESIMNKQSTKKEKKEEKKEEPKLKPDLKCSLGQCGYGPGGLTVYPNTTMEEHTKEMHS